MIRALFISLLLATSLSASINRGVMLDAIADVETGNRDLIGAANERGPYQLMPKVAAQVGGHDRAAASRWLDRTISDMEKAGIDVNSTNVALCWNADVRRVARGAAPMSSYLYAERVSNVYRSRLLRGKKQARDL